MSAELSGELLSVAMFLATIAAVMAGYPVAFTLAGVGLLFAALGLVGDGIQKHICGCKCLRHVDIGEDGAKRRGEGIELEWQRSAYGPVKKVSVTSVIQHLS